MIKNLVRIWVGVLSTLLAVAVLWQFRIAVIYVLISLMLAATIKPLFARLVGKRLFVKIIWIFTYILVVVGLTLVVIFTVQASASEIYTLGQRAPAQDEWKVPIWLGASLQHTIRTWLPLPSVLLQTIIGPDGELVLPALIGFAQNIGAIVAAGAIILILSIYWSTSQAHFERLWLSLLPSGQRKRAREIWKTVELEIGAYIRGQGILSLLIGISLGFGGWIFGSSFPALLGLIGALASLIPYVGGILIIVPTLIIGLLTNAEIALITGIYSMVVLVVFQIWIKPKLFNRRWDNPILTVILVIALADAFGIIGIVIAPPISAVCLIFWNRLVIHRVAASDSTELSDLTERLAKMAQTINAMEKPHLPMITNSLERITSLIAASEPVLSGVSQADSQNPILDKD